MGNNNSSDSKGFTRQPANHEWRRGTLVRVAKPADAADDDAWKDRMDKFDGATGIVIEMSEDAGKKNRFKVVVAHLGDDGTFVPALYKPAWLTRLQPPPDMCEPCTQSLMKLYYDAIGETVASLYGSLDPLTPFAPGELVECDGDRGVVLALVGKNNNKVHIAFVNSLVIERASAANVKKCDGPPSPAERAAQVLVLNKVTEKGEQMMVKLQNMQKIVAGNLQHAQTALAAWPCAPAAPSATEPEKAAGVQS